MGKSAKASHKSPAASPVQLIRYFLVNYPLALGVSAVGLFVAGLAESFGIASLLPLLGELTGSKASLPAPLNRIFNLVFEVAGVTPSTQTLLIIVVGLIVARVLLTSCVMIFAGRMSSIATADFRIRALDALSGARWSYFVSQKTGKPATAIANNASRAGQGLLILCQLIASTLQATLLAVFASLISWGATVLAVVVGGVTAVCLTWLAIRIRRNNRARTILTANMTSRLLANLSNMKALKAMAAEGRAKKLVQRDVASIRRSETVNVILGKTMDSLQEFTKLAALIGLFVFLITFRPNGLESMFVILVLFQRMLQNLGQVQRQYRALINCEAPFEHIQELISEAEASGENRGGHAKPSLERELRLDRVTFAYDDSVILNDVTVRVPVGHLVCLNGPSGAGKTTLLDIVCGLVRPQSGEVFIDKVPLGDVDLRAWRRQIGYVPQELILLHDTILANVTLGDTDYSEADAEKALRASGAWGFVSRLPNGLHTVVGEQGLRFSGGQRQRIAIARALVRRPRLLILDEITASLDPATEQEICERLTDLRGQVTILASSHQPALSRIADAVYRLEGGRAEEMAHSEVDTLQA
jgi:ATP-binding cassette subfamily C protein